MRELADTAGSLAAAGIVLLAAACGGGSSSPGVAAVGTTTASATTTSASASASTHRNEALAFSRCMRSHGVPTFPDPDPQGDFPSLDTGVSKETSTAANEACKRLLPSGGGRPTGGDRRKLGFALNAARCMRRHGYPAYPDPPSANASSQGSGTRFAGTGIDTKSPRFQAWETTCETQARKALGLP